MKFILGTALVFIALICEAQRTSPYSRFGLGNAYIQEFTVQKAMGNLNAAYNDASITNFNNPATLGLKRFTSFDVGFNINFETLEDAAFKTNQTNGTINNLAFAFPVNRKRNWGMGFGLHPNTFKDYQITEDIINDTYFREFEGDGNTYRVFLGTGYELNKLLIGASGEVLFGHIEDNSYNTFVSSVTNVSTAQHYDQRLSGFQMKLGAQYNFPVSDQIDLVLGGTYRMKSTMNSELVDSAYSFRPTFNDERDVSNRIFVEGFKREVTDVEFDYPSEVILGTYLKKQHSNHPELTKWGVGFDVKYGNWSDFSTPNDAGLIDYQNALAFNLGGNFLSDDPYSAQFYKTLQYRYGVHYSKSYINLNDKSINDYGITLGVGIPMRINTRQIEQRTSYANLAVNVGQKGTLDNDLVRESYFKLSLAANLNDIWFAKRKYN